MNDLAPLLSLERFLFAAAILSITIVLAKTGVFRGRTRWVPLVFLVVATGAALAWTAHFRRAQARQNSFLAQLPHQGRPGGYRSSDSCASCHPGEYASWHRTFHRTMTQVATPETVLGDFQHVTLSRDGKTCRLEQRGSEFWVEMDDPEPMPGAGTPDRVWKQIGLITGSHHMQAYWVPSRRPNLQLLFPFAFLIEDHRWVPFHSTFLRAPDLGDSVQTWNRICINCHSTAGQPRPQPQSSTFETRAAELGIACEACHGPADEHIRSHQNPFRRLLRRRSGQGDLTIANPKRYSAALSSQMCGQCHGIKWIADQRDWAENGFRYRPGQNLDATSPIIRPAHLETQPWLAEPLRNSPRFISDRYWSDGMVRVSGREYNGLVESPCHQRGNLSCISCHSLHQSSPVNQLAAGMESNEACLNCHPALRKNLPQHTHHQIDSSGSSCYNCHMPYTTYGLLKAIRSHQIGSPSAATTLSTGRPNACNLCHLDKSLAWSADHLTQWFHQKSVDLAPEQKNVSAAVLWALRGDAGQRALIAWHMGWKPARQTSGEFWLPPYLAQLLVDPYSAVRYIAARSLKRIPGYENISFDFVGPEMARQKTRQEILDVWQQRAGHSSAAPIPALLLRSTGQLDPSAFASRLQQRDDHPMDLQE